MNHQEKFNTFKNSCIASYPSLKNYNFENSLNLLADFKIPIPQTTVNQIKTFVDTIFGLSRKPEYKKIITDNKPNYSDLLSANNYSVLMSYDFHIDEDGNAKLIEINTNASCYLIGNEISRTTNETDFIGTLKKAFLNEISKSNQPVKHIAIIDENPQEQFMYIEFLMYKDLFESWGYKCSILDYKEVKFDGKRLTDNTGGPIDLVYNRYCDFTLKDPSSHLLLEAYTKNKCVFSPNPKEYILLADKQRMVEWSDPSWKDQIDLTANELDILTQSLILSKPISSFNVDDLWANKKNYFFKPTQSFGSKSVYRGKGLTRKTFERLLSSDTLVQKYTPAQSIEINEQKWKYDFRAFAYKNEVQYILARAYQGQVTNLQTKGGGLALTYIT